jgi:peptidase M48-like protein
MPAQVLCWRAGVAQVPSLYFLPSGVPTAFAIGVGDQSIIVVSSGLLRLLMSRELTGVLAHEITHVAKHDVELMQLVGPPYRDSDAVRLALSRRQRACRSVTSAVTIDDDRDQL